MRAPVFALKSSNSADLNWVPLSLTRSFGMPHRANTDFDSAFEWQPDLLLQLHSLSRWTLTSNPLPLGHQWFFRFFLWNGWFSWQKWHPVIVALILIALQSPGHHTDILARSLHFVMRRSNRNFNIPTPGKPRAFKLLIVQNPAPSGQNGVQMPYPIAGFCETNAPPKEQSSSVPVVCNKTCVHSRYTETWIQDGKLF